MLAIFISVSSGTTLITSIKLVIEFIFYTFYLYWQDMSTYTGIYSFNTLYPRGGQQNVRIQVPAKHEIPLKQEVPNPNLILSGNTETITKNTSVQNAITATMNRIISYINNQGVSDKKIINQSQNPEIRNLFELHLQILQRLGAVFKNKSQFNSPKTSKVQVQSSSNIQNKLIQMINLAYSQRLRQDVRLKVGQTNFSYNNRNKLQDFIFAAHQNQQNIKNIELQLNDERQKRQILQQAIVSLDYNSNNTKLSTQISQLGKELVQKINRLADVKQTLMKVEDSLKEYQDSRKSITFSQKILQALQNVLSKARNQAKNVKQANDSRIVSVIASLLSNLNNQNYVSYQKNIYLVDVPTQNELNGIKIKLENAKKTSSNEQSPKKEIQFGSNNRVNGNKKLQKSPSNQMFSPVKQNNRAQQLKLMHQIFKRKMQQINTEFIQHIQQTQKKSLDNKEVQRLREEIAVLKSQKNERDRTEQIKATQQIANRKKQQADRLAREQQHKKQAAVKQQQEKDYQLKQQQFKRQLSSLKQQLESDYQKREQQSKKELAATKQQLETESNKNQELRQQVQSLKQIQSSLRVQLSKLQQLMKSEHKSVQALLKEKEQYRLRIQQLQKKAVNVNHFEQQNEKQQNIGQTKAQYFDQNSWLYKSDNTKQAGETLIKEIERMNGKYFTSSTLLYRYSAAAKLQWTHFVNKPNILILIHLETNKFLAIYTLAPLLKPNTPYELTEQKALIFQYNISGGEANFYPLLPGKRANSCYANFLSVGKSDLRFNLLEPVLEGNFGYYGCFFDTKGKKITTLLGTSASSKAKMLTYQIYSLVLTSQETKIIEKISTVAKAKRQVTVLSQKNIKSINQDVSTLKYQTEISDLTAELQKLRVQLTQANDEKSKKQKKYKELEQQYDKIQINLSKSSNQKRSDQSQQQRIDQLKKKYQQQMRELSEQLAQQIQQCNERTNQCKQIEEEREQSEKRYKQEIQNLKKLQAAKQSQYAATKNQSRPSNAATVRETNQIASLRRDLQDRVSQISKLKKEVQNRDKQIAQMRKELQERSTQISNLNKQIQEKNEQLVRAKKSLQELKTQINNFKKKASDFSSSPALLEKGKMRITQTSRINSEKYELLGKQNQMEPWLVGHIDHFFDRQLLEEKLDYKIKLVREIERVKGRNFSKAKLIYQYDSRNSLSFHKYIDEVQDILLIVQTIKGVTVAGYYSGRYTKEEPMIKPSLLLSFNNDEFFELHKNDPSAVNISSVGRGQRAPRLNRGMTYDDFFILFGNAQLRIRANEKVVFSNFGISNGYFNNRGKKIHDFLQDGDNREIEFRSYEIYQVFFEELTPGY